MSTEFISQKNELISNLDLISKALKKHENADYMVPTKFPNIPEKPDEPKEPQYNEWHEEYYPKYKSEIEIPKKEKYIQNNIKVRRIKVPCLIISIVCWVIAFYSISFFFVMGFDFAFLLLIFIATLLLGFGIFFFDLKIGYKKRYKEAYPIVESSYYQIKSEKEKQKQQEKENYEEQKIAKKKSIEESNLKIQRSYENACKKYQTDLDKYHKDYEYYLTAKVSAEKKEEQRKIDKQNGLLVRNKTIEKIPLDFPETYYYAIDPITQLIKDGRADTLKEAINLYEEIQDRNEMKASAERQAEAAERQAETAADEAKAANNQCWSCANRGDCSMKGNLSSACPRYIRKSSYY